MDLEPLRTAAEKTFYDVGVSAAEARQVLTGQLANLQELPRYIAAHVASRVCSDRNILTNANYIRSIDLDNLIFDPEQMRRQLAATRGPQAAYEWSFDAYVLDDFRPVSQDAETKAKATVGVMTGARR